MRKYHVLSSEVVWRKTEVEAENYIQAQNIVESGEVELGNIFDSDSFEVSSAYFYDNLTHIKNQTYFCDNCGIELDDNHVRQYMICESCAKEIDNWRLSND